jgi:hypothetical protein
VRDLGELTGGGRVGVDPCQPLIDPNLEACSRQREADFLDELADGARPRRLLDRTEPPLGARPVVGLDGASREREVPGKEPSGRAAFEHEDLEPGGGVAGRDHGCGLADRVGHGAMLARPRRVDTSTLVA